MTFTKIASTPKLYVLNLLALCILLRKTAMTNTKKVAILSVPLSQFIKQLESGTVSRVIVKPQTLQYLTNSGQSIFKANHNLFPKTTLFDKLINSKVSFETTGSIDKVSSFLLMLTASAALAFILGWLQTDRSFFSSANKKSKTLFSDIVGADSSKVALKEVINFMKDPASFKSMGARMRKGIVFYGPSGTGKTTLAKACAGQANVPFFACNAAEFKQIYVGMGAKRVRDLFQKAKKAAPSIVYIDEIDAMGNRNGFQSYDGASSEKNTTINQLLSQMDGFDSKSSVLVIGSTNKLELLDSALLRPGRFDLKIKIALPNEKQRQSILQHYLNNKKHCLSQDFLKKVAAKLNGWSGADLENLLNESVYTSLRNLRKQIVEADVLETLKSLA